MSRRLLAKATASLVFALCSGAIGAADCFAASSGARQESIEAAADTLEPPSDSLISIAFADAPIRDALFAFADFSGRSIIASAEVEGVVSAQIRDQPWSVAFRSLLAAYDLVPTEDSSGIIRVESREGLIARNENRERYTQSFRVNYARAEELLGPAESILSEAGTATVEPSANVLVVTDVSPVVAAVRDLVEELDRPAPQIDIAAKIVFVNNTKLREHGLSYDLSGASGVDGEGPGVSLSGASWNVLGNASQAIPNPTLSIMATLTGARHTLTGFLDALDTRELSEVQAQPSVRVMDGRTARIVAGEETPIRVLDAGARGADAETSPEPVATVAFKETGVILEVTPKVSQNGEILLDLIAERSSADLASYEVGLTFRKQRAESRVLVRNGETVVIGGLTVTEVQSVRSGIPLLMDIPLLGRLFSSSRSMTIQRDLIVLVTPTLAPPAGWRGEAGAESALP